jgi:hypothetical protein
MQPPARITLTSYSGHRGPPRAQPPHHRDHPASRSPHVSSPCLESLCSSRTSHRRHVAARIWTPAMNLHNPSRLDPSDLNRRVPISPLTERVSVDLARSFSFRSSGPDCRSDRSGTDKSGAAASQPAAKPRSVFRFKISEYRLNFKNS